LKGIASWLAGFVAVGLGTVLVDELLGAPLRSATQKAIRWVEWRAHVIRESRMSSLGASGVDGFVLGTTETDFVVAAGGPGLPLAPEEPRLTIVESTGLPPVIEDRRDEIRRDDAIPPKGGTPVRIWNEKLWSLREHRSKDGCLEMVVAPSDYLNVRATVLSLDHPVRRTTLRRLYGLDRPTRDSLLGSLHPELAQGLGVLAVPRTSDGKLVFQRRGIDVAARRGELDVLAEATQADDQKDGLPDFRESIARGVREELEVPASRDDVTLTAFGVDANWYQWMFLGFIQLEASSADVKRAAEGVQHKEIEHLVLVSDEPGPALSVAYEGGMWDPGLVSVYLALAHLHGEEATSRAARALF